MSASTTCQPYFSTPNATVYQGDCRDVMAEMPSESVDIVVTDPPYLVDYRGRWNSDWKPIEGDRDGTWVLPIFAEIWRLLKPDSLCLSFYGWPQADVFLDAWKAVGFRPVSHLVCVKRNIGLGFFTRNQHETAYLLAKGKPARPLHAISDVVDWSADSQTFHPNQKSLSAISQIIASYTSEGDLVLDPFMGSGTMLVAARRLSCRAIGIEIEETYCETAAIRLSQQIFDFPNTSSNDEMISPTR